MLGAPGTAEGRGWGGGVWRDRSLLPEDGELGPSQSPAVAGLSSGMPSGDWWGPRASGRGLGERLRWVSHMSLAARSAAMRSGWIDGTGPCSLWGAQR